METSGGAIGAGLFVGTGSAFQTGGPGSVVIGFIIIGKCWLVAGKQFGVGYLPSLMSECNGC